MGIAWLRPPVAPTLPKYEGDDLGCRVILVLVPPLTLMISVLGSIVAGVAEAAAVGAIGAMLLAARGKGWDGTVYLAAGSLIGMLIVSAIFDLRLN